MLKTILWIFSGLIAIYVIVVLLLFTIQKRLIFSPNRTLSYDPEDIGLDYEHVTFETRDEVKLHGWYIPHRNAKATVLFFHGNAGDIADRMDTILQWHRLEVNFLIFDYRGYGKSEGSPSENGLYRDAEAAYEYLIKHQQVDKDQLIVMGRSLGGAIAAWLGAHRQCRMIILESTFTSAPEVAADIYPIFPARYLIRYRFQVKKWVDKIRVPILIAHSIDDNLIPYAHGKELYDVAHPPKKFVKLRGAHASATIDSREEYEEAVRKFLYDNLPPAETDSD